jgi:hypothetical protein
MKIRLTLALASMLAIAGLTGCATNPTTGKLQLDTAKLSKIEKALEPVAASATRRAIANSPQHADEIATYLRGVAGVFCDMQARGKLDPATAIAGIDALALPQLGSGDVADIKNSVIAIYEIAWDDRLSVTLPPDQWAAQVANLICNSIDRGLKDAGRTGVK